MLSKFAEDDRVEQMNAQKRRMKQQEHRRAVEYMLEERRRQSAARQVRLDMRWMSVTVSHVFKVKSNFKMNLWLPSKIVCTCAEKFFFDSAEISGRVPVTLTSCAVMWSGYVSLA